MTLDDLSLGSISGVIVATFFVIEILKRIFVTNVGFGKIPVWVLSVTIAEILAFIANKSIVNGHALLVGTTGQVLWRAMLAAASSGGFYTWLRGPSKSIGDATPITLSTVPIPSSQIIDTKDIVQK